MKSKEEKKAAIEVAKQRIKDTRAKYLAAEKIYGRAWDAYHKALRAFDKLVVPKIKKDTYYKVPSRWR